MLASPPDWLRPIAILASPPDWLRPIAILASPPDWLRFAMVPDAGFEPATFGLQNRCSTN
jgi:hypothetical protein